MTTIEKASFEATMREIRKLYRRHALQEINASTFTEQSKRLLNQLKWDQVRKMVSQTATKTIAELEAHQKQFGLSLTFDHGLFYDRGVKASIRVQDTDGFRVYSEIFIGPKFHWNQICIQPTDKNCGFFGPNMYTKRMASHWKEVHAFDFPTYLQSLKAHILAFEEQHREEKARIARGEPEDFDEIPF